jgi:outer membrane protein TolC
MLGSPVLAQPVDSLNLEEPSAISVDTINIELTQFLPPLALLIDSAIANSPEVDYYEARTKQAEYEIGAEKKNWSEHIYLEGRYVRGNALATTTGVDGNIIPPSNDANNFYQFGVGMRMPLEAFIGRSDRVKAREAAREAEIAKRVEMENLIKDRVITTYNRVASMKRLLQIYAEARESAEFILNMSEERFSDGQIGLDELGQNTELKAKYSALYENLRTDYSNEYAQLERLVGVPFSKFEK